MNEFSSIGNKQAKTFLVRNTAEREQISISDAQFWCGAFKGNLLIGVVGVNYTANTARIKAFYVDKAHRGSGVGKELLEFAMYEDDVTKLIFENKKKITVFATKNSIGIFESLGFKVAREQRNDIKFMELTKDV